MQICREALKMIHKKTDSVGRRGFIGKLTTLLSGLLFSTPAVAQNAKRGLQQFSSAMALEKLQSAKPQRHPCLFWEDDGEILTLFNKEDRLPVSAMNRVGKTIWYECNGQNSLQELSALIHRTYQISYHTAYVDCLSFLWALDQRGAILLKK